MKKLTNRGYTIIELLMSIAIMSILLIGMLSFMVNSIVNNSMREARANLLREAQLAMDLVIKDIRLSANVDVNNQITDDNSPNAFATGGLGWESDDGTLVLATAAQDSDDNILFKDTSHYITEKNNIIYYVENDVLYKRTLASGADDVDFTTSCPPDISSSDCPADRLSVKNIQSLVFHYYDATNTEVSPANARSVSVELTLHTEKYGRPIEVTYSTRTVFRNE